MRFGRKITNAWAFVIRHWSVHHHITHADPRAIVVKLHVRMIRQERHGNRGVRDFFGDHEAGQSLAERIVVHAGVPDGDFFGLPRLDRADGDGLRGNERDIPPAGGPRILRDGQRMEIDDARRQFAVLGR